MSAQTRYYRIQTKAYGEPSTTRRWLVEASSPSQALRHVTEQTLSVALASPQDIIDLMTQGVKPERAGAEDDAKQAATRG